MRTHLVAAAALLVVGVAFAQSAPSVPDHAAHPPVAASAPSPAQMEATMRSMQAMHEKMMAARTVEERQALMAEHMKAMKDGMAMMGRMRGPGTGPGPGGMGMGMGKGPMGGGGPSMHHDMMGQRMDMMEMMMRMMMDREAARAAPAK